MTTGELAQRKLDEIAAEYRQQGYDVRLHPPENELPEFLREYRPDLIAKSDRGHVVVEVRASSSVDAARMSRLAEAIDSQNGWRYEVVFVSQPVASGSLLRRPSCLTRR